MTILSTPSFSQSNFLDSTFGVNGKVITALGSFGNKGNSVAIQSNEKIVIGGNFQTSFTTSDFALIRYNNNGTLDTSFGIGGQVITPIENRSEGNSLVIQTDGKIILGGYSKQYINLVRYNKNGVLDTTFGLGGKVITNIKNYYSEKCKSIAIQSDGKIVLGGYGQHNNNDKSYFLLVRYHNNGILDSTFGTNGIVIGNIGKANTMGIQNDGKILLGGYSNLSFALERYNSNGSLDSTFGIDGKVITSIKSSSRGNTLAIQEDRKILLGGFSINNSSSILDFTLQRYLSNGSLDNTFGVNGTVITPLGGSSEANSVAIQNNEKILLAGYTKNSSNVKNFALVRYNSNGTLDNNFGTDGKIVTPIGTSYSIGNSLGIIRSNGKIVLAGSVFNGTNLNVGIVRYNQEIRKDCYHHGGFCIYPNPISSTATIHFDIPLHNAKLYIYNAYGQIVKQIINISGQEVQLSRNNLPGGIYFLQLTEKNKIIANKKLVISSN